MRTHSCRPGLRDTQVLDFCKKGYMVLEGSCLMRSTVGRSNFWTNTLRMSRRRFCRRTGLLTM